MKREEGERAYETTISRGKGSTPNYTNDEESSVISPESAAVDRGAARTAAYSTTRGATAGRTHGIRSQSAARARMPRSSSSSQKLSFRIQPLKARANTMAKCNASKGIDVLNAGFELINL